MKCMIVTDSLADYCLDMLCKLFSTGSSKDMIEQELISSAIEILTCYLHQIRNAEPESRSSEVSPDEEDEFDSQGLESDPDWAKEMQFVDDYISVCFIYWNLLLHAANIHSHSIVQLHQAFGNQFGKFYMMDHPRLTPQLITPL